MRIRLCCQCKSTTCSRNILPYINSSIIPLSTKVTYIGFNVDNELLWKHHNILNLKKSCQSRLNLLKKLAHTEFGTDRLLLIRLYRQILLSLSLYSAAAPITLNISSSLWSLPHNTHFQSMMQVRKSLTSIPSSFFPLKFTLNISQLPVTITMKTHTLSQYKKFFQHRASTALQNSIHT